MKNELDESLMSTFTMLSSAFPDGIDEHMLLPVIRVLYDEMSDRNIAHVIGCITGADESLLLNKVYAAASLDENSEPVNNIKAILQNHGYEEWLQE